MDTSLSPAPSTRRATPDPPANDGVGKTGVRLGRIFGIEVRADWSLLLIIVLLTWSLADVSFPSLVDGYRSAEYWVAALGTTLLFLASLLAHELSHSVVANRLGIRVRDITLWLFGGVSSLEGEARTPRADFQIAFAGPAMSIAIGIVFTVLAIVVRLADGSPLAIAALFWLGGINLVLAVFNLIPAAPLDGGRVLRAFLWRRGGDHDRAAIQAARAGRFFGWVLVFLGVLEFIGGGDVGGLWLVFLGWFLLGAARGEEEQVVTQHALQGVRVADVMTHSPITAPAGLSIDKMLNDYVLSHHCSAFPLVDATGNVVGLLTLQQCKRVPPGERATTLARAVATPIAEVPTASPDELLVPVLQRTGGSGGRILVMRDGQLVGIVTPTDVTRAVQRASVRAEPSRPVP
jgi:Zn-dependent protease/CBS domain-containing protein